jgi:hypothetical protein
VDAWVPLIAALVGGLLAALGTYLAQRTQRSAERRDFLLAKLERLYTLSSDLETWADQRIDTAAIVGLGASLPGPALAALDAGSPRAGRPTEELVMLARYYHRSLAPKALELEQRADRVDERARDFEAYVAGKPMSDAVDPTRLDPATAERDDLRAASDEFKLAAAARAAAFV